MIVDSIRKAIKSNRLAYGLLLPVVNRTRSIRRYIPRTMKEYRDRRTLRQFRRFCRQLPERVESPYFIKVGANDGVTGDPCSDILLADERWRGLLVEPVPSCVERLRGHFADQGRFSIAQVAVDSTPGQKPFFHVSPQAEKYIEGLPAYYDQLGSFDRDHIVRHIPEVAPFIVESSIEVTTLSDLIDREQVRELHLLHVDTEGWDYEVLKTLNFDVHAPLGIFIEQIHLGEESRHEMHNMLIARGYTVRLCGRDYFAVKS